MNPMVIMAVAAALWSTSGICIKVLSVDGLSLAGWRSAIAAITLLLMARAQNIRIRWPRDPLAWFSAISYALILVLFVLATKMTTAANAIFLQYTAPIYVLILEPLVLKTRFNPRDIFFVFVAIVGMSLFFVGKLDAGDQLGNLVALGSGLSFALFSLSSRARHGSLEDRWQGIVMGNALLGVGVYAYYGVSSASLGLPGSWLEALALLYMGVVQIGLAYALFAFAIGKLPALEVMLIGMLEPVLNPVWVYFGTGEFPSFWALVGALLIITSLGSRAFLTARRISPSGS